MSLTLLHRLVIYIFQQKNYKAENYHTKKTSFVLHNTIPHLSLRNIRTHPIRNNILGTSVHFQVTQLNQA